MISYIKSRINSDINNEKIEENVSDYSKPKMVMILGHDDSISSQVLFIIKYFNLSLDIYKLPEFASQMALEVTRNKENDGNEKLKYSDYQVSYYFDDELYINVTLDIFINIVEKNIGNEKQMDNFCKGNGDDSNDNNNNKNKESEDNKNEIENNENFKFYLCFIIALGFIIIILCVIIAFLIVKLKKKKDNLNEEDIKDKGLLNNDEED